MAQADAACYRADMAFPKDLLAENESIVFDLKPHFVALLPSFLWSLVALVGGIFAYRFTDSRVAEPNYADNAVVVAILVAWALLAIPPYLRWQFTLFVLTTDRLITRRGVIAKSSKEIPLERINDVAFDQTVLERMLKAGDLVIESAGERGQTLIENVRDPEQVQLMIFKESEKNQDRMYAPGAAARAGGTTPSIPEQIEALARLNQQGVLSDLEFETKKQELLKRL